MRALQVNMDGTASLLSMTKCGFRTMQGGSLYHSHVAYVLHQGEDWSKQEGHLAIACLRSPLTNRIDSASVPRIHPFFPWQDGEVPVYLRDGAL